MMLRGVNKDCTDFNSTVYVCGSSRQRVSSRHSERPRRATQHPPCPAYLPTSARSRRRRMPALSRGRRHMTLQHLLQQGRPSTRRRPAAATRAPAAQPGPAPRAGQPAFGRGCRLPRWHPDRLVLTDGSTKALNRSLNLLLISDLCCPSRIVPYRFPWTRLLPLPAGPDRRPPRPAAAAPPRLRCARHPPVRDTSAPARWRGRGSAARRVGRREPALFGTQLSVAQLPPSGAALTPCCLSQCDRFIPSRSAMDLNVARFNLAAESGEQVDVKDVVSPTKVRPRCRKRS
jgi:hypothetical protein